jgi:hypothetical protein
LKWQQPPRILVPTKSIVEETIAYREEQDPVKRLVSSFLVMGKDLFVSDGSLYGITSAWGRVGSGVTKGELEEWLVEHDCKRGVKIVGGRDQRGWFGIGVAR